MKQRYLATLLILCILLTAAPALADASTIGGGTLRMALPSTSPFSGLFNMVYSIDILDATIAYWITEPILSIDEHLTYDQDGAATYTYDAEAKTMTLTMKPNVHWHDGEPVTMDDLVFAYEVLAHPDYEGYFFTEMLTYIEGLSAYHTGEAASITGLVLSTDQTTLTIHFDKFMPSILEGGIWTYPLPRHQLGDVPIADMAMDERSRAKTLGYGPFKIKNVVPGEAIELEAFDGYWQGAPKLAGVSMTIVNPDMLPSAMDQGLYDVANFPLAAYADHQNPERYHYLSEPDRWYQFTGFRLGHFDGEKGENVTDPDAKMADLQLRQAIGYAVDYKAICDDFYNRLRGLNPTILPPGYEKYQNPDVTGYPYDPEKAKATLDEAGYVDVDGDGLREDPKGEPFIINYAVPNSNDETVIQFKLQCWRDVGLNVSLLSGGLLEVNAFYDMLFSDDPSMDMFESGWLVEATPNLHGAWGRASMVNFTRFASDEMDALLAALDAPEAWDEAVRVQAYYDLEQYFYEQSPAIPTVNRTILYAVGNNVQNFQTTPIAISNALHMIDLHVE